MISAWKRFFDKEEQVEIQEGDLCKVACDAIVSPANSFGFMDGGIDYAISERLGWDLQDRLQDQIKSLPLGELLIGQSLLMETGDKDIPYMIVAPSMRVPMNFNIATSVNAYLAMKATLIAAKSHPEIKHIAMPGFCTGVGRMPHEIAAQQMYQAYLEIEKGQKMDFEDFGAAQKYHRELNETGMIWDF